MSPERSFIVLTPESETGHDGILQPPEIVGLNLNVDLVFLSACETGIGKTYPGEGSLNMARPFLIAGSNSTIVTNWAIDDRFTAEFVRSYYEFLTEGYSKSLSLTMTQRAMIESEVALYNDPYFWAPFFLIGLAD